MGDFWIDIDNPPQAQYLSPVADELRRRGHRIIVTARDHPQTLGVLANRNEVAIPIGGPFGKSRISKTAGTISRAARLVPIVARHIRRPDAVLSTSRSGVIAARMFGSRCYTILDYEGVETSIYRISGTTILHPEIIPTSKFTEQGFRRAKVVAFPGLKEDISFSRIDLSDVSPAELPRPRDHKLAAILVRPPSETSHYRVAGSATSMGRVLDHLAGRDDVQVVFSPREPEQTSMLLDREWHVQPVLLDRAIPFVSLLQAVDTVVTGGGTMLREAAWFGIPAVTVFQGLLPSVDRWLEEEGSIIRIGPDDNPAKVDWRIRSGSRAKRITDSSALETVVANLEAR